MSELDLIRELRAESEAPGPERLAPGRARLSAAIAEETADAARTGRVRRSRLSLSMGTGLLVAAVVAAVLSASAKTPSAGPAKALPSSPTHATPKTSASPLIDETAAVQLLDAASVTVAAHASREPGSLQWIYTQSVDAAYGQPTQTSDNWITFDGSQSAYMANGKLTVHTSNAVPPGSDTSPLGLYDNNTTPETAYNALASLPSDPKALLAEIGQRLATHGSGTAQIGALGSASATRGAKEFAYLSRLVWNAYAAAPGSALAAVFKTMASIPGITVERGVADVVGRPTVAVSANGGGTELLLDPTTYQVVGMRTLSDGASRGGTGPAKGAVFDSLAWTQVVMVSGPGRK